MFHIQKDTEEEDVRTRDAVEYAMSFYNLEGVKAVQKDRDIKASLADEQLSDIFSKQVESMFGRPVDLKKDE